MSGVGFGGGGCLGNRRTRGGKGLGGGRGLGMLNI